MSAPCSSDYSDMWVINLFLLLCFYFNQPVYRAMVDGGAACYANLPIDGKDAPGPPPPCPY